MLLWRTSKEVGCNVAHRMSTQKRPSHSNAHQTNSRGPTPTPPRVPPASQPTRPSFVAGQAGHGNAAVRVRVQKGATGRAPQRHQLRHLREPTGWGGGEGGSKGPRTQAMLPISSISTYIYIYRYDCMMWKYLEMYVCSQELTAIAACTDYILSYQCLYLCVHWSTNEEGSLKCGLILIFVSQLFSGLRVPH